jgi:hypothetical protein
LLSVLNLFLCCFIFISRTCILFYWTPTTVLKTLNINGYNNTSRNRLNKARLSRKKERLNRSMYTNGKIRTPVFRNQNQQRYDLRGNMCHYEANQLLSFNVSRYHLL